MSQNKSYKRILILSLPLLALSTLVGCNTTKYDKKSTIYIEPFSGSGFGYKWIEELAARWKQESGYNYNVLVDPSSVYMAGTQLDQIASGISKTDIFFGGEPEYKAGIYKGYFEDLTDLLDVKPDGESGMTIKEKISDWNTWQQVGAKAVYDKATDTFSSEGMYMLPYTVTISGLIFDYDSFVEKGLLTKAENTDAVKAELTAQGISYHVSGRDLVFDSSTSASNYASGETIMRAGKDGKYGTYDDGQPITMSEFETMRNKIAALGGKPYIFSKQGLYTDSINIAAASQVAGLDGYYGLSKFDSNNKEVEMYNGDKKVIKWENGNEVYKMKGIKESVDFINDNFFANKDYYMIANQVSGSQNNFINGLIGGGTFYGLIAEGNWFENEASESFNAAYKRGGKAFGEYDLRFMLTPEFDGQKGLDGEGHGTMMSGAEYGAIVVRKQEDADKLAAIKSFLTFALKNDNLAKVNVDTGLIWGYKYTIPQELTSNMTVFQKNCYDLYHDTDNVKILSWRTDRLSCPFIYSSKDINTSGTIIPCGKSGFHPSSELLNGSSVATIVDKIRNNYTAEQWADIVNQTKTFLG